MKIPKPSEYHVLRHVEFDGYRLLTWETGKNARTGQNLIGYAFYQPNSTEPLFYGEDYGCSPIHSIDSDESLRGLISFLTLRPGDTDDEYFENYSEQQLKFANSNEPEYLSLWSSEDFTSLKFKNLLK